MPRLTYTGRSPVLIPTLGLNLAPGESFVIDDDDAADELAARDTFKRSANAPAETIAEILARIGTDAAEALAAIAAEEAQPTPRVSLLTKLRAVVDAATPDDSADAYPDTDPKE